LPISQEFDNYAKKVFEQFMKADINCEVDLKNHKIIYKIREYSLAKIPILLICGKKELDTNTITIRRLGSEKQETMNLDKSVQYISSQNKAPLN